MLYRSLPFLIASQLVLAAPCVRAADIEGFYRGKTITIVVGSGGGGMNDFGARLMAKYLQQYIPGHPSIIVQNMPGASSVIAAEFMFNVAARDGTILGDIQSTIVLNQLITMGARYSAAEFNWLGRMRNNVSVGVVWHSSPALTINEAIKKEVFFAANSPAGNTGILPAVLNRIAGTKIRIITGYTSETSEWLAVERGEVHGIGSVSMSDQKEREWLRLGIVKMLYTNGTERHPLAPYAPTLIETARDYEDIEVMKLLASSTDIGETLVAPPKTPPERVEALRNAFKQMMSDTAFSVEAKHRNAQLAFLDGAKLQALVAAVAQAAPEVVQRTKLISAAP